MYLNDTNMAKNTNLKNTTHDLNLKNENKSEISTFFVCGTKCKIVVCARHVMKLISKRSALVHTLAYQKFTTDQNFLPHFLTSINLLKKVHTK